MQTPMPRTLRLVAPAALALFLLVAVLIIASTSGGSAHTSVSKATIEKNRDLGLGVGAGVVARSRSAGSHQSQADYVVRDGDTLGAIAQRTGVSVTKLQALNPRIDPQSLISGEKLKLR